MTRSTIIDVIIPAYNEEQAIGQVVADIPKDIVRNIIVCDNNSTDLTSFYATAAGARVVYQPKRGYGSACLSGINYIKTDSSIHPDIVVFMDGDYADDPSQISRVVAPIQSGMDLVIGSRVLGNALPGSLTAVQRFGNWLATNLIFLLYGFKFTDLGPFRAIRWTKLIELNMIDENYGWTVEMQIKAAKKKLSCAEVPVNYRRRIGVSKISGTLSGSFGAGKKILWTIFKSL